MSQQPPQTIMDGLEKPYVYAEELFDEQGRPRPAPLTIKAVLPAKIGTAGGEKEGFDLHFVETHRLLGVFNRTLRRQLIMLTRTNRPERMVGARVELYPEREKRSLSGWAVRLRQAPPAQEHQEQPQ